MVFNVEGDDACEEYDASFSNIQRMNTLRMSRYNIYCQAQLDTHASQIDEPQTPTFLAMPGSFPKKTPLPVFKANNRYGIHLTLRMLICVLIILGLLASVVAVLYVEVFNSADFPTILHRHSKRRHSDFVTSYEKLVQRQEVIISDNQTDANTSKFQSGIYKRNFTTPREILPFVNQSIQVSNVATMKTPPTTVPGVTTERLAIQSANFSKETIAGLENFAGLTSLLSYQGPLQRFINSS